MATATASRLRRFATGGHLRGGIVALIGLILLIKVGGLAVGEYAVRESKPELIVATAPVFASAAARAADAALEDGNIAAAEQLSRNALQDYPLSARALRNLGLAREAQGDIEGAAAFMSLAGGLGWRDVPSQLWLLRAYAAQGDYEAALERADALARMREKLPEMVSVFMAAAIDPAGRAPLARRLAANPAWRVDYFRSARQLPPEAIPAYSEFLAAFAASGQTLARDEIEPVVDNLFARGDRQQARALWARFAAPSAGGDNILFDGSFVEARLDDGRRPSPFEWRFPQTAGSETALRPHPTKEGNALFVASPGNIRFEMAQQSLALTPGRYAFAVDAAADPGARTEGFTWAVECLPGGPALRGDPRQEDVKGEWTRLSFAFTVPPSGCGGQRLRLVLHGLQSREHALWFDDAVITRAQ